MDIPLTVTVPPRSRASLISRPVLEGLTERIGQSRVTTICGPAGSGKTTAAIQWFNAFRAGGRPTIWLAVRAGLRDLASFRLALREAGIAAGLPWQGLDPKGRDDGWLTQLATQPDQVPVVVIDDAQMLAADVQAFLGQLIASAREAITLIIVSRGQVGIPLARTRALGFLVEVEAEDLRLTPSEATQLITSIAGDAIPAAAAQQAVVDMDGWAAGLVMAAECLRSLRNPDLGGTALSGRLAAHVASYFEEEVLALQSQRIQSFLVETAVLDELVAAACVAVTQDDAAGDTLNDAYRSGLFVRVVDLEAGRYAFHGAFRKALRDHLVHRSPAKSAELHRRASLFHSATGQALLALEQANASGDAEFLADQLEKLANDLIYGGYLFRIDEVASELPWSIISTRPMLLLALAWRRIRRLSYAAAERLISAAEAIAQGRPEDHQLSYLVRHRKIMLAAARDQMSIVEGDAEQLLLDLGDSEPYLSCSLLGQLMSARHEFYHRHDLLKLEAATRRIMERPGAQFASITLRATVAPSYIAQGKIDVALRLLEESLSMAEQRGEVGSGLAALPALPFAEVLYDLGQLERAESLVERYLPVVREWGHSDQFSAGYLVRARLAAARGDTAAALAGLEEAHLIAIDCGFDRFRTAVVAEQVRILVKHGRIDEAEAALRAGDFQVTDEPVPDRAPTHKAENFAIAWLRIEMHRNRLNSAQRVATRWLDVAKRNLATRSIVMLQLLLAEISVLQGSRCKARRLVRDAIELAQPAGWVRLFLDEGDIVVSLLSESYAEGPRTETPADEFAARIVRQTQSLWPTESEDTPPDAAGVASQLVSRELEILRMVTSGLRNHEIGQRLGLTEGTVKWYLQQIFDKLGVRRRSQAALRARALGLLGQGRDEPPSARAAGRFAGVPSGAALRTQ